MFGIYPSGVFEIITNQYQVGVLMISIEQTLDFYY